MRDETLDLIRRTMDAQLARKTYPEGFPILADIPVARYHDPAFAAAEDKYLWRKSWLFVALDSELPEPGSYLLFEQLGLSVIVIRGKDGTTRAFHNICRHRASALVQKREGRAMRFVCPYHSWGYSIDGELVSVPEAHDFGCLNKADRGLLPVRCESWRGMIYLNLDDAAEPLTDFLAPIERYTEGFPVETLVTKDHFYLEMDCNWKLAFHNFLEIYHVSSVHPQLLAPYFNIPSFTISLLDRGHMRFAIGKKKGRSIYENDGPPVAANMDKAFSDYVISLPIFPNVFIALDPAGFALQSFWPVGPDRSIMEIRLVGWETADQNEGDYWIAMRDRVEGILKEDKHLFLSLQRSVKSGILPTILPGYQERSFYWFEEEIDRRIGESNIPEGMQITQLLEGMVDR